MAATIEAYRRHLGSAGGNALPFGVVSLESILAAISDAGDAELARKLDERYFDFSPIFDLIDDWATQFEIVP